MGLFYKQNFVLQVGTTAATCKCGRPIDLARAALYCARSASGKNDTAIDCSYHTYCQNWHRYWSSLPVDLNTI